MITIYQELIPLSNKMYNAPISKDKAYTNPVIIPSLYNSTSNENIMETVIYIRNDSQRHYYKDVVITLMKEGVGTPIDCDAIITTLDPRSSSNLIFSLNGASGVPAEAAYAYAPTLSDPVFLTDKYKTTYIPIVDDGIITVKFSYGYDELSYYEWFKKKPVLVIPSIGTSGMADTSYIPIRMRLNWKGDLSLFTIRDYFIDISYSTEVLI